MRQVYISGRVWAGASPLQLQCVVPIFACRWHCIAPSVPPWYLTVSPWSCPPIYTEGIRRCILLCFTETRCAVNILLIYKRFLQRKRVTLSLPPCQWRPVAGPESLFLHGGWRRLSATSGRVPRSTTRSAIMTNSAASPLALKNDTSGTYKSMVSLLVSCTQ